MKNVAIIAATAVLGLGALTAPAVAEAAPGCATPTFANGISQSVFSADSSTWVRGEAWVQVHDDSDHEGKPDGTPVDITRPAETANPACNYKAPVIFEDSPYYAGIGPEPFWPVDQELGQAPSGRPPVPPWKKTVTSPI